MNMVSSLVGMVNTGDNSKPWLIAICMIISIVVVVILFILNQKTKDEDSDLENTDDTDVM